MSALTPQPTQNLSFEIAQTLREKVIHGFYVPGQHLSEAALSQEFDVSRNTLREVFRILSAEGTLYHAPNRGVFVKIPDLGTILDVYKIRRFIECSALSEANIKHQGIAAMRQAVEIAKKASKDKDWLCVGSADIFFHAAIVSLADSIRLDKLFRQLSVDLRLVFGLLDDPEYLHEPFVDRNATILQLTESGQFEQAAQILEKYLFAAERYIVTAYAQKHSEVMHNADTLYR